MLKMEYLLEEAKELGLPQTKKRAILREYLQTIILDGIYKSDFAKSMFFVGGTALDSSITCRDFPGIWILIRRIWRTTALRKFWIG